MKELVERLRKQKEISQPSNPVEKKSPIPPAPEILDEDQEMEDDDEGYEVEEEEEKPKKAVPQKPKKEEIPQEDLQTAIINRIAQLQDNGIFRFELLQVLLNIDVSLKKLTGQ